VTSMFDLKLPEMKALGRLNGHVYQESSSNLSRRCDADLRER